MAKKVTGYIKLQIPAGQATPAPPVGPALGQQGVNIMEFCKTFNARTQGQQGLIIPVVITVYSDRSFTFVTKTRSEQGQSREGDEKAGRGDRQDENARPERRVVGSGDQNSGRNCPIDGH